MKQVVQNLRNGTIELLDVPCPQVACRYLLVQTRASLISAGTERSLVEFGRAGLISKARQKPEQVKRVLDKIASDGLLPTCMIMTVNAGYLPPDHWFHDPNVGGGRINGEACHWIDLLSFLAGSPIVVVRSTIIGDGPGVETRLDHVTMTLSFANGSVGSVHYLANGYLAYPKEKLDVFCQAVCFNWTTFDVCGASAGGGFGR